MIEFSPSTLNDIEQLKEWIQHDPYHFHQGQPEWWLGEDAILAFCLTDDSGSLCYVRLDAEGEYIRIHTQFAPEQVVSKKRLIVGMLEALRILREFYGDKEWLKGFVFNSVSPTLIAFMNKQGYVSIGDNDYRFEFEGRQ